MTVDATAVISANYTRGLLGCDTRVEWEGGYEGLTCGALLSLSLVEFYSGPYADISFVATNDPLAASTAVTGADGLPAATATGAPTVSEKGSRCWKCASADADHYTCSIPNLQRGIAGVAAPSQSLGGSAFGGASTGASASTGFALGIALLAGFISTLLG